jgi:vitamin B12 transporter
MKAILNPLFLCLLALPARVGFGQTDTLDMQAARVTTHSFHSGADDQGRNIFVISGREIARLPAIQWDDILKYLPGLEVQSRGGFGSQGDISMRGGTFQQVLILVDGVRINDPLTGHFNANIPVVPGEVDRIEVIKGAAAMNFGPEAVGGVIHIITKAYSRNYPKTGRVEGHLTGGEWQYRATQLHSSNTFGEGRHYVSASFFTQRSPGQLLSGDSLRGHFGNSLMSVAYGGKMGNKVSMAARLSGSMYDFNARFFYTRSTFDLSQEWVRRVNAHYNIRVRHNDKHSTEFNVAAQRSTDSFLFNPAFVGNFHTIWLWQGLAEHRWHLSEDLRLHGGIQYFGRDLKSNDRGNHQEHEKSAYLLAYWMPGAFRINGGLRYTLDALNRAHLTPQFNAVWKRGVTHLRTGISRSFRNPDFTERYISTGLPGVLLAGRNLGNPGLNPEFAWNYEIGADRQFSRSLTLRSTVFHRRSSNLIDYMLTPGSAIPPNPKIDSSRTYFYAANLTALNTTGWEADLQFNHKFTEHLAVRGHAGLMRLWFTGLGGTAGVSKYVASNAGWLVNSGLQITYKKFLLGLNGIYKNRVSETVPLINKELAPQYLVMNGLAEWELPSLPLRFRLQGLNLGNVRYSDILGAELPRRWWMFSVMFAF